MVDGGMSGMAQPGERDKVGIVEVARDDAVNLEGNVLV